MTRPGVTFARRCFFAGALLLLACGGARSQDCDGPVAEGLTENRYLFAGGFSWITRKGADRLIRQARRAGFNVLVPAVWKGRGSGWPSQFAEKEMKWLKKGVVADFDPLAYLIEQAHANGLEVHPWFTLSKRQADFMPVYHDDGTPTNFFNVHREDFRRFIADLVGEVAERYPVDGFNLDYVRAGGVCRADLCQQDYLQRTGHSLSVDLLARQVNSAAYERLLQWNRRAVTLMIQEVVGAIRVHRPEVPISIDTHLEVEELQLQGVDAAGWLNNNLIDLIFQMQYLTVSDEDIEVISDIRAQLSNPHRLMLLVGNFSYSTMRKATRKVEVLPAATVADFIARGRAFSRRGNGVGLFEYSMLNEAQIEALALGPFLEPAKPRGYCVRVH